MISMVCVAIFAFSFQIAKEEKTVETVTLPVTNKTIVVDAGHGVPDEGAESSTRYNRGTNKFKNCTKTSDIIRTKWFNSNINEK